MAKASTFLALGLIAALPQPALAAPGGQLRTLLAGAWLCEHQGDAEAPAQTLPAESFRVIADSSYRLASGQSGSYLLLGNDLVMTTGPLRGRKYRLVGFGILHPLDSNGIRTTDRCVRQSSADVLESAN